MLITITHQKNKIIYPNLRNWDDSVLVIAFCWIGGKNFCLGSKWLVLKRLVVIFFFFTFIQFILISRATIISNDDKSFQTEPPCGRRRDNHQYERNQLTHKDSMPFLVLAICYKQHAWEMFLIHRHDKSLKELMYI